jgi:tetraacyldisaccharide 4'-kinase
VTSPVLRVLSSVYGVLARANRRRSQRLPTRQRHLSRPVVSVGNIVVGGSGKTPVVAHITSLLLDEGESPAILSRGYARTERSAGVVVVSDGARILADLARSGDEPLMLARQVPGARVLAGPDRGQAGQIAERGLGATVHVLDDGLQHLALSRDVELVVVSADVERDELMPAGRLRESLDVLSRADALLVTGATVVEARELASRHGVPKAFTVERTAAPPRLVEPWGAAPRVPRATPVVALASIGTPQRFFGDLEREGWTVAERATFTDHHPYTRRDVARIAARAKTHGAPLVVTTEKDVTRLLPLRPLPMDVAWVPLVVTIEPAEDFRLWLRWKIQQAREQRL